MIRYLALLCVSISATGCMHMNIGFNGLQGSGKSKTETRSLAAFSKIEYDIAGNVDVKIGNKPSIEIVADDNFFKHIKTEVKNGVLVIDSDKDLNSKSKMRFTVTTPKLDGFELNGAGNVKLIGMNSEKLTVELNGAGNLHGSGLASALEVVLRGAGNVHLYDLRGKTVEATLNGAGNMEITAIDSLEATINGAGNIRYRGGAKVQATTNGVGNIKPD